MNGSPSADGLTSPAPSDAVLERLDAQLAWYERKAARHKVAHQSIKLVQIVVAAAIPVAVALGASPEVAAVMGAVIVVLESVEQLFQLQRNWTSYRTTAEALKREKHLFLAGAGRYGSAERPHARLAEAVEALVSEETTAWAATQIEAGRGGPG